MGDDLAGDASSEQLDVRIRCRTIFSIGELIDKTKFTKNEIKIIYRDFKSVREIPNYDETTKTTTKSKFNIVCIALLL